MFIYCKLYVWVNILHDNVTFKGGVNVQGVFEVTQIGSSVLSIQELQDKDLKSGVYIL